MKKIADIKIQQIDKLANFLHRIPLPLVSLAMNRVDLVQQSIRAINGVIPKISTNLTEMSRSRIPENVAKYKELNSYYQNLLNIKSQLSNDSSSPIKDMPATLLNAVFNTQKLNSYFNNLDANLSQLQNYYSQAGGVAGEAGAKGKGVHELAKDKPSPKIERLQEALNQNGYNVPTHGIMDAVTQQAYNKASKKLKTSTIQETIDKLYSPPNPYDLSNQPERSNRPIDITLPSFTPVTPTKKLPVPETPASNIPVAGTPPPPVSPT